MATTALAVLASIIHRRKKRKPIFMPRFERPAFVEAWRSGKSMRSVLSRNFPGKTCLWVAVAKRSLFIAPHFPFSLAFFPEIFGWHFAVSGTAIRSVERLDALSRGGRVRVTTWNDGAFVVFLRDPEHFVRALDAIRRVEYPRTPNGRRTGLPPR